MKHRFTFSPGWRSVTEHRRQERITDAQLRLPRRPPTLRTRRDYLSAGRWWALEASRGYGSSSNSERYARNMCWAAELATLHGPGTWLELIARAGVGNPEARRG